MPDVLSPEQRRRVMRRVRNKNTDVELRLRHGLYSFGLRYRLHDKTLPGTPDLVFAKFRTAVFVHGCFWHRHSCPRASVPVTRHDFWSEKLAVNVARDEKNIAALTQSGWRVLVVWECALRGLGEQVFCSLVEDLARHILYGIKQYHEFTGKTVAPGM